MFLFFFFFEAGVGGKGEGGSQSAERHLQDFLKMSYQDKQDILPRHLANVQKMS